MTIRPATMADMDGLLAMGARFLAKTAYGTRIAHNPQQLQALAQRLIDGDESVILVAELEGQIIGMLGALVFPHPMSGEQTASEVFWWSEGKAGVALYEAAVQWARTRGATILQMVAPTPVVARFYRRRGFSEVETLFQREIA